jgi:hypothetical protein
MSKSETLGGLAAHISKAIESFGENESAGKQLLNQLANSDPAVFFAAGIHVLAASKPSEGSRYLVQTLAKDKRLSIGLLDPKVCTAEQAMAVTRAAAEAGTQLQATFAMALNKALQGHASPQSAERILRILDVLAATADQNCWNAFQVELMAYPDSVVRSRAALLIGRSTRNVAWIGRRLLDRDPRVQAAAMEALWGLEAGETKPHYMAALKSKDNQVVANAALGLYLSGDVTAMRILRDLLQHEDPLFRLSAVWAIGETEDERFLSVLSEYYKHAEGKLRLAAVGAMSKIRRRDKSANQAAQLHIHMSQLPALAEGRRRLTFALSCHPARDLSGIKSTEFAVWENGILIHDYVVRLVSPPVVLLAGFIAPWSGSGDEPYEKAVREGLKQCLSMKRRGDLWRIDRYSVEINPQTDEKSSQEAMWPYDDSLTTPELKAAYACSSNPELLEKALALPAPLDRAAPDPVIACQRQCNAFTKHGGKRHLFLFLHEMSGFDLKQDAAIERLRTTALDSSTILHGICPDVAGQWALVRDLCLSNPEGSFTATKLDGMVDGLMGVYANLCSQFEISYSLPASAEQAGAGPGTASGQVKLRISSGLGKAEISVDLPSAAAASVPAAAASDGVPTETSLP